MRVCAIVCCHGRPTSPHFRAQWQLQPRVRLGREVRLHRRREPRDLVAPSVEREAGATYDLTKIPVAWLNTITASMPTRDNTKMTVVSAMPEASENEPRDYIRYRRDRDSVHVKKRDTCCNFVTRLSSRRREERHSFDAAARATYRHFPLENYDMLFSLNWSFSLINLRKPSTPYCHQFWLKCFQVMSNEFNEFLNES